MRALFCAMTLQVVVGQLDIEAAIDLLKGYITPQEGPPERPFPVSEECLSAGAAYLDGLGKFDTAEVLVRPYRNSSAKKFDASAFFPPSGLTTDSNLIHFPGSFSGCLNIKDDGWIEKDLPRDPRLDGRYALLTIVNWETLMELSSSSKSRISGVLSASTERGMIVGEQPLFLPERKSLEALARFQGRFSQAQELEPMVTSYLQKVGKCVPKVCTDTDITNGAINYLSRLGLQQLGANASNPEDFYYAVVLDSHTKDEEMELSTADIVMISVVALFVFVIALSTWLDVSITVLDLPYVPKTLLPYFQGFSAYHNIIKICKVDSGPNDGSNLSCINGLKYISITWIVLGHTLAEYTGVLSMWGIFSSSAFAHQVASTGFPFVAVWNGLLGVDTFLVIGGCLLAFHTLKELDKTKGGSIGMWVMFYVHRWVLYKVIRYSVSITGTSV